MLCYFSHQWTSPTPQAPHKKKFWNLLHKMRNWILHNQQNEESVFASLPLSECVIVNTEINRSTTMSYLLFQLACSARGSGFGIFLGTWCKYENVKPTCRNTLYHTSVLCTIDVAGSSVNDVFSSDLSSSSRKMFPVISDFQEMLTIVWVSPDMWASSCQTPRVYASTHPAVSHTPPNIIST